MLRLYNDLLDLAAAAARGRLEGRQAVFDQRCAVTVMAVSKGYPGSYEKGKVISGNLFPVNSVVFQAGTVYDAATGRTATSGGRVLSVSSYGASLPEAIATSYASLEGISFQGLTHRHDIGKDLLE